MSSLYRTFSAAAMLIAALCLPQFVSAGHHEGAAEEKSIVDIAAGAGSFTTLITALEAADLKDTLSGEGPFTVLAPTDAAFAALPDGALDALLADPEKLAEVLTLHVVSGKAMAADVATMDSVTTLAGPSLPVSTEGGVSIGGASVVTTDVMASNGVIHVIDRVILPQS